MSCECKGARTSTRALARKLAKEEESQTATRAQARKLARKGRGGDNAIAHVTPGEIVVPQALQTPEVMAALDWAAAGLGIELDRFRVNAQANSINPETGAPEFWSHVLRYDTGARLPEIVSNGHRDAAGGGGAADGGAGPSGRALSPTLRKHLIAGRSDGGGSTSPDEEPQSEVPKDDSPDWFSPFPKRFDYCDHGLLSERCEGWVPNFLKDKPLNYMPTPDDLAKLSPQQRTHYAEYYEGLSGAANAGGAFVPLRKLYSRLAPLIGKHSLR